MSSSACPPAAGALLQPRLTPGGDGNGGIDRGAAGDYLRISAVRTPAAPPCLEAHGRSQASRNHKATRSLFVLFKARVSTRFLSPQARIPALLPARPAPRQRPHRHPPPSVKSPAAVRDRPPPLAPGAAGSHSPSVATAAAARPDFPMAAAGDSELGPGRGRADRPARHLPAARLAAGGAPGPRGGDPGPAAFSSHGAVRAEGGAAFRRSGAPYQPAPHNRCPQPRGAQRNSDKGS